MATTINLKKFHYQTNTFINDEDDRKKFRNALEIYKSNRNVKELTDALKIILDRPERLRMYDVLRPLIPLSQQMEYNMLVPYISNKTRKIQLNRRKGVTSFGFAIRGGREHGIGVFVSEVVEGSEASRQGLIIGDQIVRVNGLSIEEAVHEEVLSLMQKSRTNTLELVVKSVGMIPIKTVTQPERPTSFPQALKPPTDANLSLLLASQTPTPLISTPSIPSTASTPVVVVPVNLPPPPVTNSPSPVTSPATVTAPDSTISVHVGAPVLSPTSPPSLVSQTSVASDVVRNTPPARSSARFSVSSPSTPLILSPSYEQLILPKGKSNAGTLSWRLVNQKEWPRKAVSVSSTHSEDFQDVKVILTVKPTQKFGCNICKGPQERPGIYIQSTREGGIAHEVGLRAGDKIMEANGKDLESLGFQEAVGYLKSCKFVELVVRRGVGVDLFPGESSGYNSSNSSTVGEHTTTPDGNAVAVSPKSNQEEPSSSQSTNTDQEEAGVGKEIVADVIVHKAEDDVVKEIANKEPEAVANASPLTIDSEEDERRSLAILRHQKEREEAESRRNEMEEEKKRNLEYISRMEVETIEDEYLDKGQYRKDSLLLQRRLGSSQEFPSTETVREEEEVEETDSSSEQEKVVIERMENTEKMVRTAEILMERNLSRSSSNSSGGDSGLHMNEITEKETENEKWKKTVLAEIHNTPRPSLTGEGVDGSKRDSEISVSAVPSLNSSKSSDNLAKEKQNEMQKRSQHDQNDTMDTSDAKIGTKIRKYQPTLVVQSNRRASVFTPVATTTRRGSAAPIGNPAAHKFVETPQVSKVVQDPMKEKSPAVVFPPPQTPIFGKITDSNPVAPRPPDYFFPKTDTKPKVVINAYVGNGARPAPKRFEYLKQHPSVELSGSQSPKPQHVTKVLLNKPEPKIQKPVQVTAAIAPETPKKVPGTTNVPKPATETSNNNPSAGTNGFVAARLKFMNMDKMNQEIPSPGNKSRGPTPATKFQNNTSGPKPGAVNGVTGGTNTLK